MTWENYKNDSEFREWLRKDYKCCECQNELFFFQQEKIDFHYCVDPFQVAVESKKTKKCLKHKEEKWRTEQYTKSVKDYFEWYQLQKLRKNVSISEADQAKVIEFYKRKHCSPDLKCSQCGDFSISIEQDEEGIINICETNYDYENNIYCKECIKGKNHTGSTWGGNHLYDIWEEWKKENKETSSFPSKSENPKEKSLDIPKNDKSKTIERNLKLENESKEKNNSPLFIILIIALIIETLVIFAGITYLIIKKKAKK